MIIGNFEKSRVYFKAVSAIVPRKPYTVIVIVKQSLLNFQLIHFS